MREWILPNLPADQILAVYRDAPGNELISGKFGSPESSAALAANTFGLFLDCASLLPPIPNTHAENWLVLSIKLEHRLRFPWSGGAHPCLDVVIETEHDLIGIESKRFEPFRVKHRGKFSPAYRRQVWGNKMRCFETVRDDLMTERLSYAHLDAVQLVKHAFGLRTAVHRSDGRSGKAPLLLYLYAEPEGWPDGKPIPRRDIAAHSTEIAAFADRVRGDEVRFAALSYHDLLKSWLAAPPSVAAHSKAVLDRFRPCALDV